VRITLDAFSLFTHKKIRGTNGYDRILSNILTCLEYKRQFNSDIDIGISYVVYENNIYDLFKMKSFVNDFPVDYIYIKPGVFRNKDWKLLLKQKIALFFVQLIAKNKYELTEVEIAKSKIKNTLSNSSRKYFLRCFMGLIYPTLGADSCLYYCCHHVGNPNFFIGDTLNKNLNEIYTDIDSCYPKDLNSCPINCRGHILNEDIENAILLIENKHTQFL
jgi:sulfatase maturation enzyme AslB (radical SAM superfamily)